VNSFLSHTAKLAVEAAIAASMVSVVIRHADELIEIAKAGFGELVVEAELLEGQAMRVPTTNAYDLICWPADLVKDSGESFRPDNGDLIRVTFTKPDGSQNEREFHASPFEPDPVWRYTDRFETAVRIHMKQLTHQQ